MRITLRIVECHGHSFTPWRKLYFLISIIRGFHFPVTRHSVLEPTTLLEMGLGGGQVVFHSTPTSNPEESTVLFCKLFDKNVNKPKETGEGP